VTVGAFVALTCFYVITVAALIYQSSPHAGVTRVQDLLLYDAVIYFTYTLIGTLVFWRVAAKVYSHVALHIAAMYLLIQVIDIGVARLLQIDQPDGLIEDLPYRLIGALPALAGWGLATWQRRRARTREATRELRTEG
jgi:hypothetical protein